jgi:hypothetical protein
MVRRNTSKVPPPKSHIKLLQLHCLEVEVGLLVELQRIEAKVTRLTVHLADPSAHGKDLFSNNMATTEIWMIPMVGSFSA